mmetsp:Transcript_7407/g.13819  ORF Transcript_7407/g.13819 Transcript_7407/m.13819 type:complete len:83 (+) Transcript_7407:867-1115(+)
MASEGKGSLLPLELLEKCIGQRIWLIMSDDREISGLLSGYDDYMNFVLEDASELEGTEKQHWGDILLNASQVCMIVPGAELE